MNVPIHSEHTYDAALIAGRPEEFAASTVDGDILLTEPRFDVLLLGPHPLPHLFLVSFM